MVLALMLQLGLIFTPAPDGEWAREQDTSRVRNELPGTWTLVKHVVKIDGKSTVYSENDVSIRYDFMQNGAFRCYYLNAHRQEVYMEGQWEVSAIHGKRITLRLYNIMDVPDDPVHTVGDHALEILNLNKKAFTVEEYLFSEEDPGVSTFQRVK